MSTFRPHPTKRLTASLAAVLGVTALVALSACTGGDDKPDPTSSSSTPAPSPTEASPTPESPTPDPETSESADETTEAAPAGLTKIRATTNNGKDPVLEHTFHATAIALGFKGEGDDVDPPGGAKWVAIQISGKAGSKYFNGLSCTAFKLWDSEATIGKGESTSLVKEAMEKQGLKPLERIKSGQTGEGWCMYYLQAPTKDNLTLEYSRLPLKDSSGKQYPAESKKMPVTPEN